MKLLPKSVFGRLVLVLLAGLLAAQVATVTINLSERDQLLYRTGGLRLAQQIADIVQLLDSLPAADRLRVAALFDSPPLKVSLDRPPIVEKEEPGDADFPASMFKAMLRRSLGEDAGVKVVRSAGAPDFSRRGPPGMPGGHRMWGREGPPPPGPYFTVQIPLSDATLVTFESGVVPQAAAVPQRVALTLLVLVATVIAISLIAVRWVTEPLSRLAAAAERLGGNIHEPPMPEDGPVEVQRAAKAFNAMQQRLSRFIADRVRILAAMSHDLKTPITRMRLRTEMLEDGAARAKFERDLAEMESMVTQTLEFMRDSSAEEPVQPVDLMALLETLSSDYRDAGKPVELSGRVAEPYAGRPLALRRCLTNLVENAVRYGEAAAIAVEDGAGEVVVRIRDRGPGIPEGQLERVFEPFYRGEASRSRETGGTGLGLGIARNIARAHGGDIVLRNHPGGGLEAVLTLPRTPPRARA
ncbi:MAG TPA: ATP-binding protein [Burkholderiales bacterium]|nr:ATP-binding protein [Burkholderiales bacterium]